MLPPRRYLPSINLLSSFEAAARLGSFTAAAQELNLTQGAVSRQIKTLEDQLNVLLFIRERQTIRLTDAGEEYVRHIREALKIISAASFNICTNPDGGTLNLAILPTFGTRILAPLLPHFMAEAPQVTVHLSTHIHPVNFDNESLDAAIHFGDKLEAHVEKLFLLHEHVVPVCSPEFKKRYQVSNVQDLISLPLLHMESRPFAWQEWFRHHHVEHSNMSGMFFDQFATAAQAAIAGLGVALIPEFLFREDLEKGALVPVLNLPLKSSGAYYLTWPKERDHYPPLKLFRNWIKGQFITS